MLSSRYLHLHEALELGPMWLKQGARVRPSAAREAAPAVSVKTLGKTAAPAAAAVAEMAGRSAREAVLAAVGGYRPPAVPERVAETPPHTAQDYRRELSGKVEPSVLMAVSICPAPADVLAGRPLSGEDGVLFDKMLAAIGLKPADAYRTFWLDKLSFHFDPERMAAAVPRLQAERLLCAPRAVLLLDRFFEQSEQSALVEQVCGGLPFFVIPHPASLLSRPALKRGAWETLQKLRDDVLNAV
ncbi:MAG: uracil-DNA glycosylase family protein [Neisseria sp.]|nr:uracil-DNA glycosylase family protein [Neisseria sp.]